MIRRVHIPKSALYTAISVLVLLVIFVGGGVAYVWYTGQDAATPTVAITPTTNVSEAMVTPSKPAPDAKPGASVQMLTSPVSPGENASMTVKTLPTATCTIKVEYNKIPSTDSGLVAKKADEFGMVSWTWTVDATVPQGTWPATVTCTYNNHSAIVQGDLQVAVRAS